VCLRASDQAGHILAAAAAALPVFLIWPYRAPIWPFSAAVAPTAPATLAELVLGAAALILAARLGLCAALRAAHRRGLADRTGRRGRRGNLRAPFSPG